MKPLTSHARVVLAPDGFYPQALQGRDGMLRVLGVEEFRTTGIQRRFRVRTPAGAYDLRLDLATGIWQIHRRPGWLARVRALLAAQPRYPLPAARRRAHLRMKEAPLSLASGSEGGGHASRLTLVRQ
jgi:hypothetical protein